MAAASTTGNQTTTLICGVFDRTVSVHNAVNIPVDPQAKLRGPSSAGLASWRLASQRNLA